jgi:hypothetical protein
VKRTVIILEGPIACGKTTLAGLIAGVPVVELATAGGWHVTDFQPRPGRKDITPCGVRELAEHEKLIICCEEFNPKKFYHWWAALLANAQVFYWRLERQDIVLKKPTTITFKQKHI